MTRQELETLHEVPVSRWTAARGLEESPGRVVSSKGYRPPILLGFPHDRNRLNPVLDQFPARVGCCRLAPGPKQPEERSPKQDQRQMTPQGRQVLGVEAEPSLALLAAAMDLLNLRGAC